jgi:apolipoprotein N-acyltransferase
VAICSETYYPTRTRAAVQEGAEVLLSLSNDAWFKTSGVTTSHLVATAFRAVELDRWMICATNTGFSAVIDPRGRCQTQSRVMEKTILFGEIEPRYTRTLYARFGEWFSWLCLLIVFAAGLQVLKRRAQ